MLKIDVDTETLLQYPGQKKKLLWHLQKQFSKSVEISQWHLLIIDVALLIFNIF